MRVIQFMFVWVCMLVLAGCGGISGEEKHEPISFQRPSYGPGSIGQPNYGPNDPVPVNEPVSAIEYPAI
jgi:hypothetical protein